MSEILYRLQHEYLMSVAEMVANKDRYLCMLEKLLFVDCPVQKNDLRDVEDLPKAVPAPSKDLS